MTASGGSSQVLVSAPDARAYFFLSCQEESAPTASPGCAGVSALLSRNGPIENHPGINCPLPGRLSLVLVPFGRRRATEYGRGRRRGLSEGRSPEFRSRPAVRVAQGTPPKAGRRPGVAFSLASFFWRPKRKNARASGAEPRASEFITPLFHFAWNCFPAEQSESPGYQQGESHA